MDTSSDLKSFLEQYDAHRNLKFFRINVFPYAKLIEPFGLHYDQGRLYFSRGSLYSNYSEDFQHVYSPFKSVPIYHEDKRILELTTDYKFSVYVYHIIPQTFTPCLRKSLREHTPLTEGSYLGKSGQRIPFHKTTSYIEVVQKDSTVLDDLLALKYPSQPHTRGYTAEELQLFFDIHGIDPQDGQKQFQEIQKKLDTPINSFRNTQFEITYYSFSALF